jgi:hypothetical protein
VSDRIWSEVEKEIAQVAFNRAYERETTALIAEVRDRASTISAIDELWQLHDFLSARRHQIDGKYDYDYSSLLFVFAKLIDEGWLHLDEMKGLDRDKLSKMAAIASM